MAAAGPCVPVLRDGHEAEPKEGEKEGAVYYGKVLNDEAVLLWCYGNVPEEREEKVKGMLLDIKVWAGWVDKEAERVEAKLGKEGLDAAMLEALAAEDVLVAEEKKVKVLDKIVTKAKAKKKKRRRRRRRRKRRKRRRRGRKQRESCKC